MVMGDRMSELEVPPPLQKRRSAPVSECVLKGRHNRFSKNYQVIGACVSSVHWAARTSMSFAIVEVGRH